MLFQSNSPLLRGLVWEETVSKKDTFLAKFGQKNIFFKMTQNVYERDFDRPLEQFREHLAPPVACCRIDWEPKKGILAPSLLFSRLSAFASRRRIEGGALSRPPSSLHGARKGVASPE